MKVKRRESDDYMVHKVWLASVTILTVILIVLKLGSILLSLSFITWGWVFSPIWISMLILLIWALAKLGL